MLILSVECSASPASCAIIDNGKIKSCSYVNTKLTHSQTLVQMIISTLDNSATRLCDIDYIAVAAGPGSFTGLRIGISAVKGLAAPNNIPCISVSSLAGIAECFSDRDCIICAVMDARCNQFYNAVFKAENGTVTRICDDRALTADELIPEILNISSNKQTIICGDGADLFFDKLPTNGNIKKAAQNPKFQSAVGVGMFAYRNIDNISATAPKDLLPVYLRLPQAERELKAKMEAKK